MLVQTKRGLSPVSFDSPTSEGNTIVVCVTSEIATPVTSVTDDQSQSYTQSGSSSTAQFNCQIYYLKDSASISKVTASVEFAGMCIYEISGVASSSTLTSVPSTGNGGSPTGGTLPGTDGSGFYVATGIQDANEGSINSVNSPWTFAETSVNQGCASYVGSGAQEAVFNSLSGSYVWAVLSASFIVPPVLPLPKIYTLDYTNYPPTNPAAEFWNCTDSDYGPISSYYYTYFFFSHDIEQNAMLALYRKIFCYMSYHAIGTGTLTITPYVDALNRPWASLPQYTLSLADPGFDYESPLNVTGNRMALNFSSTNGAFELTHLIVSARKDLVFPVRGTL